MKTSIIRLTGCLHPGKSGDMEGTHQRMLICSGPRIASTPGLWAQLPCVWYILLSFGSVRLEEGGGGAGTLPWRSRVEVAAKPAGSELLGPRLPRGGAARGGCARETPSAERVERLR